MADLHLMYWKYVLRNEVISRVDRKRRRESMDDKNQINGWWVIPIALLLPAYHLLVFFLRFGRIGSMLFESIVFLPAGMIEGIALIYWLRDVKADRQRRNILIGF